jgi:arginine decarboxylase
MQPGPGVQHPAARVQGDSKAQGVKALLPGAITYCVMSRCCSNEPRRLLSSSVGLAIPADKKAYGYISEHHAFGRTEKETGELCGRPGRRHARLHAGHRFQHRRKLGRKKEIFKISGKIVSTRNITQSTIVKNHWYTTVVAAAVFVF